MEKKNNEDCIFLKVHAYTIYESRPLICRTHGLPLLYTNEDGEWELSNCELNFKDTILKTFQKRTLFRRINSTANCF